MLGRAARFLADVMQARKHTARMLIEFNGLAFVFALVLVGAAGFVALWPKGRGKPSSTPKAAARPAGLTVSQLVGSEVNWLKTADAQTLLHALRAGVTLEHMLRQSRLATQTWQRDLLPAIHRYAEFVQLMPASEAHHHAHAGGLLAHTLEMVLAAMTWRNGSLLPPGAGAEVVDHQRDHWTYVVFFAALLHDAGKPITDLRIQWRSHAGATPLPWTPAAGSLVDCQALEYLVQFAPSKERDYSAHSRASGSLLQRIAPASALRYLSLQPGAMLALTRYLAGEDRDGPIAAIVKRADRASAARAALSGSRARFGTATKRPLVEVLMQSLQGMLQRGGELPLNRDGAAGWVFDGSVWFVAKRLADAVRKDIERNFPDEAIPGEERNDRLFDTWQEHGCLQLNPATGQAIWRVTVHGEAESQAYSHTLAMLRFPISILWTVSANVPHEMHGRIELRASSSAAVNEAHHEGASLPRETSGEGRQAGGLGQAKETPAAETAGLSAKPVASSKAKRASPTALIAAPVFAVGKGREAGPDSVRKSIDAAPAVPAPSPLTKPGQTAQTASDCLLGDDESAQAEARRERALAARAAILTPVVLPTAAPIFGAELQDQTEPGPLAIAFANWLKRGLSSGEIRYNASGALVHFVPQGMALVSPRVFREFAFGTGHADPDEDATKVGLDVQREFVKAGWHLKAGDGTNIHQFSIQRRGGARPATLSVVVVERPERWILPVPSQNSALAQVSWSGPLHRI